MSLAEGTCPSVSVYGDHCSLDEDHGAIHMSLTSTHPYSGPFEWMDDDNE